MSPAQAPTFVPTQVIDPNYTALRGALETIGALGQNEAKIVKQIWGAQRQLLNRVSS